MTSRLDCLLERDHNSLDFIRFICAVVVIFSHAFLFALGVDYLNLSPLGRLVNGLLMSGLLAVAAFFVISGFLVTASLDRSQSAAVYAKGRLLRIYPALIVMVVATIFIVGPLMTSLKPDEYFRQPETYEYFKVLGLYNAASYTLPGVFTTNAFPSLVNGSVWTLFWEALCYVILLILWGLKLLKQRVVLAVWLVLVIAHVIAREVFPYVTITDPTLYVIQQVMLSANVTNFFLLTSLFFTGMVFYLYRDQVTMRRSIVLAGLPLFVLSIAAGRGLTTLWSPTFGAYTLFYLASAPGSPFNRFSRHGDFSYGLYIYAPPIQQSITHIFGGTMLPMVNFALAFPVTLVIAILSWHLVEAPALKLKTRLSGSSEKTKVQLVT